LSSRYLTVFATKQSRELSTSPIGRSYTRLLNATYVNLCINKHLETPTVAVDVNSVDLFKSVDLTDFGCIKTFTQ